jgi:hypothetical protein
MGKQSHPWDPSDLADAQEACEAYAAYAQHTGVDKTGAGLSWRALQSKLTVGVGRLERVRRCPLLGKPDIGPTSPNDRV